MAGDGPPLRSTTGRRILAAFGVVLALFGAALAVELTTLRKIGEAESEVARLDHAKHAGHMAAAEVREQYIHQAHTLIEFGPGHLGHYEHVVKDTNAAIADLEASAETASDRQLAGEIAQLARQNDRDFRTIVVPAIERGDREAIGRLGDDLEAIVDRVVELNDTLNANLEARSVAARHRANVLRSRSVMWTIICFALAIVLSAALGIWLMRTIVRRVESLRAGARRVGAGDLSARIELEGEDEFAELASSFNQMAASLAQEQEALVRSQKLASIGQVAAGVAHEINNPLSVILGYTKILRKESTANAEELQIIEDEAKLCQRIVHELLELARPQRLEMAAVDLAVLAREAIERLTDAGALRDRRVRLLADTPVVVAADAGKLRQVIANVVVNAAEATSPDSTITVDARAQGDQAMLTVADNGPGIPAEIRSKLFEPFVTTKPNGTGLGLAIAQAIVDAHGGRISIESEPDAGTLVRLQLPVSSRQEEVAS